MTRPLSGRVTGQVSGADKRGTTWVCNAESAEETSRSATFPPWQSVYGNGQIGSVAPQPYQAFDDLFPLAISGVNVGDTVATYVDDVRFSGSYPHVFSDTPGAAVTVTAPVDSSDAPLDVPPGETIANVTLNAPATPVSITPSSAQDQPISGSGIVVGATDQKGKPVTQLNAPVAISSTFSPPAGVNPYLGQIYTRDPNGRSRALARHVTKKSDDTFTAAERNLDRNRAESPPEGKRGIDD